ncbi:MAG TPA: hypothetical protein VFD36_26005, partial [Kofleriaceae bacterium]|nr:hypothetical protein [Kofleriaceae bacterium]
MRIAWLVLTAAACGRSSPPVVHAPPAATPPAAAATATPPAAPATNAYPATDRRPVTDTYGNVKIVDDYRWLEDAKDPAVQAWTAAQNQLTRSRLDALPDRQKIHDRVAQLLSSTAPEYLA